MTAQNGESGETMNTVEGRAVRVWDLPVRLFHWALVIAVVTSVATGLVGGLWQMDVHMISGYVILGLVIFRVVWGLIGGRHARFAAFLKGPVTVIRYAADFARRREAHTPGHNPIGGWSVIALLTIMALQAGTGLFANDDIFLEGPLFSLVSKETSDWLTGWHHRMVTAIYILVGLHVAAIAVHWLRGDNLVKPMVTGTKTNADPAADDATPRPVRFLIVAAVAVAAVFGILALG